MLEPTNDDRIVELLELISEQNADLSVQLWLIFILLSAYCGYGLARMIIRRD